MRIYSIVGLYSYSIDNTLLTDCAGPQVGQRLQLGLLLSMLGCLSFPVLVGHKGVLVTYKHTTLKRSVYEILTLTPWLLRALVGAFFSTA